MSTINKVLKHFSEQLNDKFSAREKTQIGKMFLMSYLDIDATDFILRKNETVEQAMLDRFDSAIQAINAGKPVQYVLGKAYFYGLELEIDERALIPRPETEELVDWVLEEVKNETISILDVGTGSGCIALALKANLTDAEVYGVDQSDEALSLAQTNAENLRLNVHFEKGDALNLANYSTRKWEVIISNPPYIPISEAKEMKAHVLDFEPEMALFVPNDEPLLFYKAIAKYAKEYLVKKGNLYFEIHENLAEEIVEMLKEEGFERIEVREDLQGKKRMVKVSA